ncbi:unnamed protein product [Sphenostylis stenocarpa]|uniref:Uncharacterized protein n=1 Tax=Sphenostylis stenocarpa TaxID=92480 RepID=A0AA86T010_9FABA|nr:unnamed protein product [Sphenostylis stenocarpa]
MVIGYGPVTTISRIDVSGLNGDYITSASEKEESFMHDSERAKELKAFHDTKLGVKGLVDARITLFLGSIDEDPTERKRVIERVKENIKDLRFLSDCESWHPEINLKEMIYGS